MITYLTMRHIKLITLIGLVASLPCLAHGQEESDIMLMVVPADIGETVPQRVSETLQNRLAVAVTQDGVTAGKDNSPFFITGVFNHSYLETTPGPPIQQVVTTTLTLYMGDIKNKQVFATESYDLRGVGRSEERALLNALNRINGKDKALQQFIERGKEKIIAHFDENYQTYLQLAQHALKAGNSDEALYYATLIPAACKGYDEADKMVEKIYKQKQKALEKDATRAQRRKAAQADAQAWNKKRPKIKLDLKFIRFK